MACDSERKTGSPGQPSSQGCLWSQGCEGCEACAPVALCFHFKSDDASDIDPLCCCAESQVIVTGRCGFYGGIINCGGVNMTIDFQIRKVDETSIERCHEIDMCRWRWISIPTPTSKGLWEFVPSRFGGSPKEHCESDPDSQCSLECPEPGFEGEFQDDITFTRCADDAIDGPYSECKLVINAYGTDCYGTFTDNLYVVDYEHDLIVTGGSIPISIGQVSGVLTWSQALLSPNLKYRQICGACRDPFGPAVLLEPDQKRPPDYCTCLPQVVCLKVQVADGCSTRTVDILLNLNINTMVYSGGGSDRVTGEVYSVEIETCGVVNVSCGGGSGGGGGSGDGDEFDLSSSCTYLLSITSNLGLCFKKVYELLRWSKVQLSRLCDIAGDQLIDEAIDPLTQLPVVRTIVWEPVCGACETGSSTCTGACESLDDVAVLQCNPRVLTATIVAPGCDDLDGVSWEMYESIGTGPDFCFDIIDHAGHCQVYKGGPAIGPTCEDGDPLIFCFNLYYLPVTCTPTEGVSIGRYRLIWTVHATCLGDYPSGVYEESVIVASSECNPIQLDFSFTPPVGIPTMVVPYPCSCCDGIDLNTVFIRITE